MFLKIMHSARNSPQPFKLIAGVDWIDITVEQNAAAYVAYAVGAEEFEEQFDAALYLMNDEGHTVAAFNPTKGEP